MLLGMNFYVIPPTVELLVGFKMADASMEGIDLYADVDDFVRVSS